jgi:transposase-like protein
MFKYHRYPKAIILQAIYFKLRFTLSYPLETSKEELGFVLDLKSLNSCWIPYGICRIKE